ncbi:MAG: ABC transporter substrate-binding protein [Carbonactinosporaceae bacterium]
MTGRRPGNPAVAVLAATGVAMALAGCGSDAAVESTEQGTSKIRITVTHHPTLLYSVPYIVGMKKGFFADENIVISEIAGSEGGGTTVRNVLAGDLPFGEVATPAAAQALAAGSEVVAIGGAVQSVAEINWVVPKDSRVRGIEDVKGQTVAYTSPGSVTQGVLALSLDEAGVPPGRVTSKALGGISEGLTALDSDSVDGAANLEPVYSDNPDPYHVAWWANEYVPDFQQTVVIAGAELVEEQPALARGFLRARARAVEWLNQHPEEAGRMWAKEADLDPAVTIKALRTVLKDDYYGVGFSEEGLEAVDHEMDVIDLLPQGTQAPWEELINQDLLPKGVEQIDTSQIGG